MTAERFQQLRNLFDAALERDPADRTSFLDAACRGDLSLRQEVARLLEAHESDEQLPGLRTDPLSREGSRVGPYEILREIGRGAQAHDLGGPALLLGLRVRRRHERSRGAGQPPRRRRLEPGHLPVQGTRRRHRLEAAQRPARLRHQQGRVFAHYGLYPDWLQDLRKVAGATGDSSSDGANIVKDMSARSRGRTCRCGSGHKASATTGAATPMPLKKASVIRSLPRGGERGRPCWSRRGQPHSRLGRSFSYCAKSSTGEEPRHLTVKFRCRQHLEQGELTAAGRWGA